MRRIAEALDQIEAGWSPERDITERAFAILRESEDDDLINAQELAEEIEQLQHAHDLRHRVPGSEAYYASLPEEVWQLPPDVWARIIVKGAFRLGRRFGTPETAPTREHAISEAIRIYKVTQGEAERVCRVPAQPVTAIAAE